MNKSKYIKYQRTYHLPNSEGRTSDDKVLVSDSHLLGKRVIITEKRDGEGTAFYNDHIHARSIDSKDHESRHWVKGLWSKVKYSIPENIRIYGENLFALHSVSYNDLNSYFEVFSIWQEDVCLSWQDTKEWCELLGLTHVPELYEGIYHEGIEYLLPYEFWQRVENGQAEGYVVRLVDSFKYDEFSQSIAKWVRKNHVTCDEHWLHKSVVPNKLKEL